MVDVPGLKIESPMVYSGQVGPCSELHNVKMDWKPPHRLEEDRSYSRCLHHTGETR